MGYPRPWRTCREQGEHLGLVKASPSGRWRSGAATAWGAVVAVSAGILGGGQGDPPAALHAGASALPSTARLVRP
jgi:hypothetical protein